MPLIASFSRTIRTGALLCAASLSAHADALTSVVRTGPYLQSVRVGATTFRVSTLITGSSSGVVDLSVAPSFSAGAADSLDLDLYFARSSQGPLWSVDLGSWVDPNASDYDFFLFEVGGNDSVEMAARLADGSLGQFLSVSGWTSTGFAVTSGPNAGQLVHGLAVKRSQLKLANGNPISSGTELSGIVMRSSSIDGAAFLAVNPDPTAGQDGDGSVSVHGSRCQWEPIEIDFEGPWACESDDAPNPFLDYRLQLALEGPSGQRYSIPGFFAGDGAGGRAGRTWRVRFTPDEPGAWRALASFRAGSEVAVDLAANAGTASHFDGRVLNFQALPKRPEARGFWRWGRLEYVGAHYAKFSDGPWYVKGGTNSPENLLAYEGMQEIRDMGGIGVIHRYESHRQDWRVGDPNFRGSVHDTDAKGLIGMLNYLAEQGVNSVYTMLMNLGGDGQDIHPFIGGRNDHFDKLHYDIGRTRQWNIVFEHAASLGLAMHFGLAETEAANERWLDYGNLSEERKLFYREMVARFAHLPALKWNLCEETDDFTLGEVRDFADYIESQDAYAHDVTFHNHTEDFGYYDAVLGESRFAATSLQYTPDLAGWQVESMRSQSAAAGQPWVVQLDENNPWFEGLTDTNSDDLRKRVLYDVYFSGGQLEWYLGWHQLPLGGDLTVEDMRTREAMWVDMHHARRFLEDNLPFWEMQPMDSLLSGESSNFGGGEVFAKPGQVYALYLPSTASTGTLDLSGAQGSLRLRWFDPRAGHFVGGEGSIAGGAPRALGSPPNQAGEDWVVLIDRANELTANSDTLSTSQGGQVVFSLDAGAANAGRDYLLLGSYSGTSPGVALIGGAHLPLNFDRYSRFLVDHANTGMLINTSGTLGSGGHATARIQFPAGMFSTLTGSTLHHAYLLVSPQADFASVALPLALLP